MSEARLTARAVEDLRKIREKKPLIHNITNFVVMNFTANVLLSMGASPVMAHAREEVADMVSLAGALVLNIGTLTTDWVEAMIMAGRAANKIKVPIILDPVGSGATRFRTESAQRILSQVSVTVVRGNASEILSLNGTGARTKGVDSVHGVDEAAETAAALARELGTTLAITGPIDLVTDGGPAIRVANGHRLLGLITGTGCAATAVIGAFLAVDDDPLVATAAGLAFFGLAGEMAASQAHAPGGFQTALLDALYLLDEDRFTTGAKFTSAPV